MAQKYQATLIRGTSHTLMGVGKFLNGVPVIVDDAIKEKLERCVEMVTLTGSGSKGVTKQQVCRFKFVKCDANGNPVKKGGEVKAKPAKPAASESEGLAGDTEDDAEGDDEGEDSDEEDDEEEASGDDGDAFDDDEDEDDDEPETKPAPAPAKKKAKSAPAAKKGKPRDR